MGARGRKNADAEGAIQTKSGTEEWVWVALGEWRPRLNLFEICFDALVIALFLGSTTMIGIALVMM